MSNILIAFPNRADAAILSGGSWSVGLPLGNLQDRLLKKYARAQNTLTTSTKFEADLGNDRAIRVIALVNHNLSLTARYRITAGDSAGFITPVYESGWLDVWPSLWVPEELEWEAENFWDGKFTDEDRDGYPATLIHMPDGTLARYWRVEIDDSAPANPDGYVQIGRLFMAEQWQPVRNFSHGASLSFESRTRVTESEGGVEYFGAKRAPRLFSFDLRGLSDTEAYTRALELYRRADVHGEVLIIPDPTDELNRMRRAFLCRLKTINPIEQRAYDLHSTSFVVKELL